MGSIRYPINLSPSTYIFDWQCFFFQVPKIPIFLLNLSHPLKSKASSRSTIATNGESNEFKDVFRRKKQGKQYRSRATKSYACDRNFDSSSKNRFRQSTTLWKKEITVAYCYCLRSIVDTTNMTFHQERVCPKFWLTVKESISPEYDLMKEKVHYCRLPNGTSWHHEHDVPSGMIRSDGFIDNAECLNNRNTSFCVLCLHRSSQQIKPIYSNNSKEHDLNSKIVPSAYSSGIFCVLFSVVKSRTGKRGHPTLQCAYLSFKSCTLPGF